MRTLFIISLVLALTLPATAEGCTDLATGSLWVFAPVETDMGSYYLYYDHGCDPECHGPEWWLIEESNGIEGAQFDVLFHPDRCAHTAAIPDTIVL